MLHVPFNINRFLVHLRDLPTRQKLPKEVTFRDTIEIKIFVSKHWLHCVFPLTFIDMNVKENFITNDESSIMNNNEFPTCYHNTVNRPFWKPDNKAIIPIWWYDLLKPFLFCIWCFVVVVFFLCFSKFSFIIISLAMLLGWYQYQCFPQMA